MIPVTQKKLAPRDRPGPYYVSPSQLKTYDDSQPEGCNRRWGFIYLDGLPRDESAATRFGSAMHKAIEDDLNGITRLDLTTRVGKVAAAGIHFVPRLHPLHIEGNFNFERNGFHYRGVLDVRTKAAEGHPLLLDHKSSSNIEKYALTPTTLTTDTQAVFYAYYGLLNSDHDIIDLRWIYYRTRGAPKGHAVDARMTRNQVAENFVPIEQLTRKVHHDLKAPKANDLRPNPSACHAYNKPCPYLVHCNLTQHERMSISFKESSENTMPGMSIFEVIADPGTPPAPQSQAINPPEAPPTVEAKQELSQAVGAVEGKRDERKDKTEELAAAASQGQSIAEVQDKQADADKKKKVTKAKKKALAINEVWLQLAVVTQDVKKTEELFDAYLQRFAG